MSWSKKGEYEIAYFDKNSEMKKFGKKNNVNIESHHSVTDWWSPDITIGGENPNVYGQHKNLKAFHGITTVDSRNRNSCLELWKGVSEEIPGLKCYFCDAQGFKTDMPGVAVCGAAPGWFFFYRRIAKETKPMLKIVNGELVETTEEGINL